MKFNLDRHLTSDNASQIFEICTYVCTWGCFFSIINVYWNYQVVIVLWTFKKKRKLQCFGRKKINYVLLHGRSPKGHFPRFGVQRFIIFQIRNNSNGPQHLQYPTYECHKMAEKQWRYQYHGQQIHWKYRWFSCPKTGHQQSGIQQRSWPILSLCSNQFWRIVCCQCKNQCTWEYVYRDIELLFIISYIYVYHI